MAQKINPTSYRLGKSLDWSSKNIVFDQKEESYFISEQLLIRNLINNLNKKKNIFTSEIIILRTENQIQIKFLYFKEDRFKWQKKVHFYFLKYLLEKLLCKFVYIKAIRIYSIVQNSQILNEYLKSFIQKNPRRYKTTLKRIIKDHQILGKNN